MAKSLPRNVSEMDADSQADVRQIEEILRRLETAENAGHAHVLADLLTEDAVLMVPDQPVQEGKAVCAEFIREVLSGLLREFDRRITYVSDEVNVMGDVAFDRGTFSIVIVPRAGGDTIHENGKYFFFYLRAADRSWKAARVIVNLDASEASAET